MAVPRTYLGILLYVYTAIILPFPPSPDPLKEYDYIVVGAGSTGATLASRLSEDPKVRVLLLEAGGVPSRISNIPLLADHLWNSSFSWNYHTVPQEQSCLGFPNKSCFWPRGKMLGGTSELNGMIYVRGNRGDYDGWQKLGIEGWSYEDVLPYFKKAENMTINSSVIQSGYHGYSGPVTLSEAQYKTPFFEPFIQAAKKLGYDYVDYNGQSQLGFAQPQINTRNGVRCGAFNCYLEPAKRRKNLDIVTGALVRKIQFDSDKRATGVEFSLNGNLRESRARKEIILSAGAIASPQLLLLSGIGPKEDLQKLNIDVVQDLPGVGRNLQDHISSLGLSFVTNVSKTLQWKYSVNPRTVNQYNYRKKGPLTVPSSIDAIGFIQTNRSQDGSQMPDNQIYLILRDYNDFMPEEFTKPYQDKHIITFMNTPLKPKSLGTVTLRSNNPEDHPLVDPRHFTHPDDLPVMVAGIKFILAVAQSETFAGLGLQIYNTTVPGCENMVKWSDEYLGCMAKHLTFSTSHNVGTCRMGALDDPETVVDSQLRVKGVKNLRVADASIIPIVVSGNTNAPSIMVGEKAADIIRGTKSM